MQFLSVKPSTKFTDLVGLAGLRNVENILRVNGLTRTPNVGQQFKSVCDKIKEENDLVPWQRKQSVLNKLVGDTDVFEKAALSSEDDWKVLSSLNTFSDMLRIPPGIKLPDSVQVLGDEVHVDDLVYRRAMTHLIQPPHVIDPEIFNSFGSIESAKGIGEVSSTASNNFFQYFRIPWGQVSLFSSITGTALDFPVYPEELSDKRSATYTTMPDMLYQYEPWQVYQSSGPRSNTYVFTFHRDMWTGDHRDGKANELIRFCQANCYPEYNGSAIHTALVKLYISGEVAISGVLTDVSVNWSGPLGLDGYYLVCRLSLSITEVSEDALNFHTVLNKHLIG